MLRTRYIVKPRLQIKYLLIALLVVCVTALAVYYAFWSSLVRAPGLDQLSAGEMKALENAYQTSFVWVVALLALAIGLESIFLFHRLAGPVFVFERAFKAVAGGDLTAKVHYRRRDELKDTARAIQAMIDNIRAAVADDRKRSAQAVELLDKGDPAGARKAIASAGQWFKI